MASGPLFRYNLCDTDEKLAAALSPLRKSEYLFIDLEARDLGHVGGALSLISVGTVHAEHIFLLDAVALDPAMPAMQEFLDLLSPKGKIKIFWDGRMDAVEIQATYGRHIAPLLDLQVAEVASRTRSRRETDKARMSRLARMFGAKSKVDRKYVIWRTPDKYADIHLVCGMDGCLRECNLGKELEKDPEVVKMHRAEGSGAWMTRPLPERLLQYAARDIYVMSRLYEHFCGENWIYPGVLPALLEQSARYVASAVRERRRVSEDEFFIGGPLMPLDVITSPKGSVVLCKDCQRAISLKYFERNGRGKRSAVCRRCRAVTISKQGEPKTEWVPLQ